MRLLIVAALFLIFSTACASPILGSFLSVEQPGPVKETSPSVGKPVDGKSNRISNLSEDKFRMLVENNQNEYIAGARLASLRRVTIRNKLTGNKKTYQILSLWVGGGRDFKVEQERLRQKVVLWNDRIIGQYCHFIVDDGSISTLVPNDMKKGSDKFKEMREEAGKAFTREKWDSKEMKENNDPDGYFYTASGDFAVFVSTVYIAKYLRS